MNRSQRPPKLIQATIAAQPRRCGGLSSQSQKAEDSGRTQVTGRGDAEPARIGSIPKTRERRRGGYACLGISWGHGHKQLGMFTVTRPAAEAVLVMLTNGL
ncbi:hypothetical protein PAAG_06293 [Paracoccidioides lutzii Pb01]|uniref:Uncharacterized protein n=1 Tax=Paracoccidioides lutzii (strain ATCC MYA-826 / Pb01) TaxID=502779 RepID=C1H5U8_PARBA|nr:hypothetical protein PAAG_06293 [Paracoccidioides lutzii Pb01]EEH35246.2 hypothetical protein PAAG_06293 [Paracoccidioides lutzii Pb01]